jgi:hypothetical protein
MRKATYLTAAIVALIVLNPAWADDGAGDSSFDQACISTDPNTSDSAAWAISAVELFASEQYADAVTTVDACFVHWGPTAGQQQKELHDKGTRCPPVGKVSKRVKKKIDANGLLNDVSMALWAKARSLHELDRTEPAKQAYAQCIYMTCGRAWDPQGWFWSPAQDCAEHARKLLKETSQNDN